ncbi:transmembrane protein 135-like [Artemia franciscana]
MSASKLICSCYDAGHPWTTSCADSAVGVGAIAFKQSLRIYTSVYLLSYVARGKKPVPADIKKLLRGILQSSAFLGFNGFGFIGSFCAVRYFSGGFTKFNAGFLPAFIGSFLAILIERPSRRGQLALYVTNVASESVWRMLVARGIVKSVRHGEVLVFMLTLAALVPWYRRCTSSRDSVYSLSRFIIGGSERFSAPIYPDHGNRRCTKHALCKHKNSCIYYMLEGFVKKFIAGYGIHAGFRFILSFANLLRNPRLITKIVSNMDNVKFGLFVGGISGIVRSVLCNLRWITGKDRPEHGVIAGFLGGLPMLFYKSTTLASYLMWKTIEVVYREGIQAGKLPAIPGFIEFLYSFSTAMLFHMAVFEPHNLKPSYWKFLVNLTDLRFAQMNRQVLDLILPKASSSVPFWPKYEADHVSQELRSMFGLNPHFSMTS